MQLIKETLIWALPVPFPGHENNLNWNKKNAKSSEYKMQTNRILPEEWCLLGCYAVWLL
jgi:hypothetical protein